MRRLIAHVDALEAELAQERERGTCGCAELPHEAIYCKAYSDDRVDIACERLRAENATLREVLRGLWPRYHVLLHLRTGNYKECLIPECQAARKATDRQRTQEERDG